VEDQVIFVLKDPIINPRRVRNISKKGSLQKSTTLSNRMTPDAGGKSDVKELKTLVKRKRNYKLCTDMRKLNLRRLVELVFCPAGTRGTTPQRAILRTGVSGTGRNKSHGPCRLAISR